MCSQWWRVRFPILFCFFLIKINLKNIPFQWMLIRCTCDVRGESSNASKILRIGIGWLIPLAFFTSPTQIKSTLTFMIHKHTQCVGKKNIFYNSTTIQVLIFLVSYQCQWNSHTFIHCFVWEHLKIFLWCACVRYARKKDLWQFLVGVKIKWYSFFVLEKTFQSYSNWQSKRSYFYRGKKSV